MSSLPQRNLEQPLQSQEQFFGVTSSDVSEETRKQMKQNLKMEIRAANNDKFMPPVYYLLKS